MSANYGTSPPGTAADPDDDADAAAADAEAEAEAEAAGESDGGDTSGGDGDGLARGGLAAFAGGGQVQGAIRQFNPDTFTHKMMGNSGLVPGLGGGRADSFHVKVPRGAYIIPADVVSGAGQGNTLAGARAIAGAIPRSGKGMRFAGGGLAGDVPMVPIRISSGEFVVHPSHVAELGDGDPEAGSAALDQLVANVRQQAAQQVAGMPPPR